MTIDASTRRTVRRRAGNRCEYCLMPQSAVDIRFHVEHVLARQHRLDDSLENLVDREGEIREQNPMVGARSVLQLAFETINGESFAFIRGRAAREHVDFHRKIRLSRNAIHDRVRAALDPWHVTVEMTQPSAPGSQPRRLWQDRRSKQATGERDDPTPMAGDTQQLWQATACQE